MVKRVVIFFVVIAMLLSAFVSVASAQEDHSQSWGCRATNILSEIFVNFHYNETANILAVAIGGQIILYDLDWRYITYTPPSAEEHPDTLNVYEIGRTNYDWGEYKYGGEVNALQANVVSTGENEGFVALNFTWGLVIATFDAEGFQEPNFYMEWLNGRIGQVGNEVFLTWNYSSSSDAHHYGMITERNGMVGIKSLLEENPVAFETTTPAYLQNARIISTWRNGEIHERATHAPRILASTPDFTLISDNGRTYLCYQD